MGISKTTTSCIFMALLFFCILPSSLNAKTPQKDPVDRAKKPMIIKSNTLEVDDELNMITFTGNVNAKKDDLVIKCRIMRVYYEKQPGGKKADNGGAKVEKIVATGDVKISRAKGELATSEKAVYYQGDEKVVLTGKPVVKKGDDFVEGEKITIFLKKNRSIVEGAKDRKVKAVIFPRDKGK